MKRKHPLARVHLDDDFEFEPDEEVWVTQRIAGEDYAEAYFAPDNYDRYIYEFAVERMVQEAAARAFIKAAKLIDSKQEGARLLRLARVALKEDEDWFQRLYKDHP